MKTEFTAEIAGDPQYYREALEELMKEGEPTFYAEMPDGKLVAVCRLVKVEGCPQELYDKMLEHFGWKRK